MLRECTNSRCLIYLLSPSGTSFRGVRAASRCFLAFIVNIAVTRGSWNNEGLCSLRLTSALRGAREKSHKSLYKGRGGARRLNGGRGDEGKIWPLLEAGVALW